MAMVAQASWRGNQDCKHQTARPACEAHCVKVFVELLAAKSQDNQKNVEMQNCNFPTGYHRRMQLRPGLKLAQHEKAALSDDDRNNAGRQQLT